MELSPIEHECNGPTRYREVVLTSWDRTKFKTDPLLAEQILSDPAGSCEFVIRQERIGVAALKENHPDFLHDIIVCQILHYCLRRNRSRLG